MLLLSFVLMAMLGFGQFFVLKYLLKNVLDGNMKKTLVFLLLKLALYGIGLPVVFIVLKEDILLSASGFCVGLPGAVLVFAIKNILFAKNKKSDGKGDDKVEATLDN